LSEIDETKLSLAVWLMAKRLVENETKAEAPELTVDPPRVPDPEAQP
jgi:hypothetical protein